MLFVFFQTFFQPLINLYVNLFNKITLLIFTITEIITYPQKLIKISFKLNTLPTPNICNNSKEIDKNNPINKFKL